MYLVMWNSELSLCVCETFCSTPCLCNLYVLDFVFLVI
jgi:hypothetical protein